MSDDEFDLEALQKQLLGELDGGNDINIDNFDSFNPDAYLKELESGSGSEKMKGYVDDSDNPLGTTKESREDEEEIDIDKYLQEFNNNEQKSPKSNDSHNSKKSSSEAKNSLGSDKKSGSSQEDNDNDKNANNEEDENNIDVMMKKYMQASQSRKTSERKVNSKIDNDLQLEKKQSDTLEINYDRKKETKSKEIIIRESKSEKEPEISVNSQKDNKIPKELNLESNNSKKIEKEEISEKSSTVKKIIADNKDNKNLIDDYSTNIDTLLSNLNLNTTESEKYDLNDQKNQSNKKKDSDEFNNDDFEKQMASYQKAQESGENYEAIESSYDVDYTGDDEMDNLFAAYQRNTLNEDELLNNFGNYYQEVEEVVKPIVEDTSSASFKKVFDKIKDEDYGTVDPFKNDYHNNDNNDSFSNNSVKSGHSKKSGYNEKIMENKRESFSRPSIRKVSFDDQWVQDIEYKIKYHEIDDIYEKFKLDIEKIKNMNCSINSGEKQKESLDIVKKKKVQKSESFVTTKLILDSFDKKVSDKIKEFRREKENNFFSALTESEWNPSGLSPVSFDNCQNIQALFSKEIGNKEVT